MINLADLLHQYSLSLGHTKPGDQERNTKSTRSADISKAVSKHTRPILGGLIVELLHVCFELGDILCIEYFSKDGRGSRAVFVGDSIEEEGASGRQASHLSDGLNRLVLLPRHYY